MLDMLSDVFDWPMAVDNWEINYGRLLFSTVIKQMSYTSNYFHSHCSFFLLYSGETWRLENVIAKLNEKYGTHLLVNFFVGTNDRDSNSHIIHVGVQLLAESPGLSLLHKITSIQTLTHHNMHVVRK